MRKYKKIILAAGTGQLGTLLVNHFKNDCEQLIILSRNDREKFENVTTRRWDGKSCGDWWEELEGADVVINLAGKNINCRYTEENKREIIESRVNSIKALAEAAKKCKVAPGIWIQCASGAIYNHNDFKPKREGDPQTGEGFLADVCRIWESTFYYETKELPDTRKVTLRISLVLGNKGGAYPPLRKLVRLGLGGMAGNGKQYMSWMLDEDLANVVDWVITHSEIEGPVNCATPGALSNKDFMMVMRKQFNKTIGLPAPAFVIKLGAIFMNTEADLILKSMWQYPEKLIRSGFNFKYARLEEAVKRLKETE